MTPKNSKNRQDTIGFYAGSFDPVTYGHLDIIRKGSTLFQKLIVAIGHCQEKKYFFGLEERTEMLRDICKDIKNLKIITYSCLTVDAAQKEGANFMLRGIRSEADFNFEQRIAMMNEDLDKNIKTVFILSSPQLLHISSTLIKEIAVNGGDVSKFVSPLVERKFCVKFMNLKKSSTFRKPKKGIV